MAASDDVDVFTNPVVGAHGAVRKVDLTGDYETTIYDVARQLLAEGADPIDEVWTYRTDKWTGKSVISMKANIGWAAKWTVVDDKRRGLAIRRWKPFPDAPVASRTAETGKEGTQVPERELEVS